MIILPLSAMQSKGASVGPGVVVTGPTIRLVTSPTNGDIGNLFTTVLYADGVPVPGLGAWQAHIAYNNMILEVEQVIFGVDLFSTGRAMLLEAGNTDTPGQVLLSQATYPGPDGISGDGVHTPTRTPTYTPTLTPTNTPTPLILTS